MALSGIDKTRHTGTEISDAIDKIGTLQTNINNLSDGYVTLDTAQRISGQKVLNKSLVFQYPEETGQLFLDKETTNDVSYIVKLPAKNGTIALLEDIGDVPNVFELKGDITTLANLNNVANPETGWIYHVTSEIDTVNNRLYYYDGTKWTPLNGITDLSAYSTTEQMNLAIKAAIDGQTKDSTPTQNSTNLVTSGGVKSYVDNTVSTAINNLDGEYVKKSGDTITGNLTVNTKITLPNAPVDNTDAVNKAYVDSNLSNAGRIPILKLADTVVLIKTIGQQTAVASTDFTPSGPLVENTTLISDKDGSIGKYIEVGENGTIVWETICISGLTTSVPIAQDPFIISYDDNGSSNTITLPYNIKVCNRIEIDTGNSLGLLTPNIDYTYTKGSNQITISNSEWISNRKIRVEGFN